MRRCAILLVWTRTDAGQAAAAHRRRVLRVVRHRRRRKRRQVVELDEQLRLRQGVDVLGHRGPGKGLVLLDALEVPAAAQHQLLADGRLDEIVAFLGYAVFVALAGLDPTRVHLVVVQHRLEPTIETTTAAFLQLVSRRRG